MRHKPAKKVRPSCLITAYPDDKELVIKYADEPKRVRRAGGFTSYISRFKLPDGRQGRIFWLQDGRREWDWTSESVDFIEWG